MLFLQLLTTLLLYGGALALPPPLDANVVVRDGGASSGSNSAGGADASAALMKLPKATINPSGSAGPVTITGTNMGCKAFLGIPFAEPPTGKRRFAPPVPKVYTSNNLTAMLPPPACLQANGTQIGKFGISEDCLTLNVLAHNDTTPDDKLPVMVWIYGGGFTVGAATLYNSPPFINRAHEVGRPVILVTVNYRVGLLGFGYGEDIAKAGAANLGLRDQIQALRWVKENIAAFGGDPEKVTVFGESAGAISVALLMLNETTDLFRGAIMQSGAQSTAPLGNTSELWNQPYNITAQAAGCMAPNTTNLGNLTTFECLRNVPADTILSATAAMRKLPQYSAPFVFGPSVDGDLVPDSPWELLKAGKFAKMPYISGTNRDEGTSFVPAAINSTTMLYLYIQLLYPEPVNMNITEQILAAYPDDPALGSPFGTGNETFGLSSTFKRASAIVGDVAFQSRRRWFLRQSNKFNNSQTWTYDFWGPSPTMAPQYGIAHAVEVPYVFGIATQANNYTAEQEALGRSMMDYWTNFAYHLNPNGGEKPLNGTAARGKTFTSESKLCPSEDGNYAYWPQHQAPGDHNSLRMIPGNLSVIQDTYREDQMKWLDVHHIAEALFFKRDE